MAKKLARKSDKRLLKENQINDLNESKSNFSSNWQGRIFVRDAQGSYVAKEMGIIEKGEYAIKVR